MVAPLNPHHPIHAGAVETFTGSLVVIPGLREIQSFSAAPAEDLSIDFNAVSAELSTDKKSLTLKAWKPTSNANPTPIAATLEKKVVWVALGK